MNNEIIKNEYLVLDVLKVTQSIGSFYITKINPKDLLTIANDSLSRMKDAENGIQRDKDPRKIKEIQEYLKRDDATFPNSIIICLQKNPSDVNPDYILSDDEKTIHIKLSDSVANILDGQHRLAGFSKDSHNFELPISIFLDLSLGQQAEIFAQINSKQKKVPLDLVYELFGITDKRSMEQVSYHIVNHLNTESDSPWKGKIKTLSEPGDIAQGSMAKYIHMELLNDNKILNELFNSQRDTDIKNIIKNYFIAVKNTFTNDWEKDDKRNILKKTTGFGGFSAFMIDLIKIAKGNDVKLSVEYFQKYLNQSKGDFKDFNNINYPAGVIGQNLIRNTLRKSLSAEEKELLGI